MKGNGKTQTYVNILNIVEEILEAEGYEAIRLRDIAKSARVSLATIYRFFPTRDDLILEALERWMDRNCYSTLGDPPRGVPLRDGLNWLHQRIFTPWARSPRMIQAYHRARAGPGGHRLDMQGMAAVKPVAYVIFADVDPTFADDIMVILAYVVQGVIDRFALGEISIEQVLPVLDRAVLRLTSDNARLASGKPTRAFNFEGSEIP